MATYAQTVTAIANAIVVDESNADFLAIFPTAINYAEDRIYRELDLLSGNIRDSTNSTTASNRNFNLPTGTGTFLIIDGLNVITPASTAPDSGTRNPLIPVSRDFLDLVYPSVSGATLPQYFAYLSQDTYTSPAQTQVILGPWPDATYRVEVIGKIQPTPLSASNTQTWLSVNMYDLFFSALMVWMTGWQMNFAGGSDNPSMAVNWEKQYQSLRESAAQYAARARFGGASWTSKPVEPAAVPQRG